MTRTHFGCSSLLVALATWLAPQLAGAAPWYARGEFNAWGTANEMVETAPGSNVFRATVEGLTPNARFEFKVGAADWSTSFPANNARVYSDAAGKITFFYYAGPQGDGWGPSANRVGYADPGITWDLMGSFNGWTTPFPMTGNNGVYSAEVPLTGGTEYKFKFRKAGDWDLNVGQTFEHGGADAAFTPAATDTYRFVLDLDSGAWNVAAVPEPSVACLLGAASLPLLARGRRRPA